MWRAGCFAAGLPVGALAGVGFAAPGLVPVAAGALLGGAVLLLVGSLLGRGGRGGRGRQVAAAAQTGWLALPAVNAAWLDLAPGPLPFLALAAALLAAALAGAARGRGPRSALATGVVSLLAGLVLVPGLALALAAAGASAPALGEGTASAIFDLDARVVTRPLPRCASAPAGVEVLLERGAHPRLGGERLFFDAAAEDGRRQVQRVDPAGGEPQCLTCAEPGNNRRPAPAPDGRSVVFDSDRWAELGAPANTELQHLRVTSDGAPHPSRRLTHNRTRDDHAVLSPLGASLLWSRQADGRFMVASAGFRRGHGALLLSRPVAVAVGGAAWTAPVAWSADARALAIADGNPLGPLRGQLLDPATGALSELGAALSGAAAVDFSADGGRMARVETEGAAGLGALPAAAGLLLGALPPDRVAADPPGGTRLHIGDTGGELSAVELGEAGAWGAPTGVASSPDGTWLVLGQRRKENGTVHERLLRVTLDCSLP